MNKLVYLRQSLYSPLYMPHYVYMQVFMSAFNLLSLHPQSFISQNTWCSSYLITSKGSVQKQPQGLVMVYYIESDFRVVQSLHWVKGLV